MPHFVIVANGNFLVKEILVEAMQGKTIIALDGAAGKLRRLGLKPHIILGDFDSISEATAAYWGITKTFASLEESAKPYAGNQGVLIVPAKNQDYTDLDKAIDYCDQQQAESITLLCAAGGRLDHHEGVKLSLRSHYRKDRPILLYTEQQTLRYAKDESLILTGKAGDKCGVIASHTGKVSSRGLEYECKGHSESICNALLGSSAELHIQGEALVIAPPQLAAQRQFMQKTEEERLLLLLRDAKQKASQAVHKAEKPKVHNPNYSWLQVGLFATAAVASVACALKLAQGALPSAVNSGKPAGP
jgi:thiamine pyrophosphokinase